MKETVCVKTKTKPHIFNLALLVYFQKKQGKYNEINRYVTHVTRVDFLMEALYMCTLGLTTMTDIEICRINFPECSFKFCLREGMHTFHKFLTVLENMLVIFFLHEAGNFTVLSFNIA